MIIPKISANKPFLGIFSAILALFLIVNPVFALSDSVINQYAENNILFYKPDDGDPYKPCTGDSSEVSGNLDYAGNQILSQAQLMAMANNRPVYEKVGTEFSIPWGVLAVIHLRETGLSLKNPANRLGLFQITDGVHYYEPSSTPVSGSEFESQARDAATHLKGKINSLNISESISKGEPDAIKKLFFAYNGMASAYKTQAKNLGFSDDQAGNGEGSPYVMNRADLIRDPTSEPTKSNKTWGQIKVDYGSIQYPANSDYGAFVVYASVSGISVGCGLTEGGMTEEQAKTFMMRYGENVGNDSFTAMNLSPYGKPSHTCNGGAMSNCVSFSAFFMNKFSNTLYYGGDGKQVVSNLAAAGVPTGSEPRVYSTFSWGNSIYGHTGIVLGIQGDIAIVGHASCSSPGTGRGDGTKSGGGAGFVLVGKISEPYVWLGKMPSGFAYLENVDTNKITEYIKNGR